MTQYSYQSVPAKASYSLPSIFAIIAAAVSFFAGAAWGFILAIAAIVLGILGFILALLPRVRGGIISVLAIIAGVIGIVLAGLKFVF